MYPSHRISPDLEVALRTMSPSVAAQVRETYADYTSLLKTAERDRQVVLGFIDTLGMRLDELVADPDISREKAIFVAKRSLRMAAQEAIIDFHQRAKELVSTFHTNLIQSLEAAEDAEFQARRAQE